MSDTTQQTIRSPAERTVSRIREALTQGDTACVAQVLEVVQQMSGAVDQLSVQELADTIGRDLTTVAKIMKAANCLGYNPAAADVSTLPQAIGIIGFEAIRNLVISLLLMESAEKRFGEEHSHNVAAAALSTALMAKTVAERIPGLNSEQAFVCGALRHYGKLLLSTFLPDEYLDALELSREMGLDKAFRTTCGLTPVELGLKILSESNIPKIIQQGLEPAAAEMIRSKKLADSEKLVVVADFAEKFSAMVGSPDLTTATYKSSSEQLLKTYAPSIGLDEEGLEEVLAKVSHSLSTVGQVQGVTSFAGTILNRFSRLADGRPIEKRPASNVPAESSDATSQAAIDALALGVAEIEKLVAANPIDGWKAFTAAARAIRAGLRARSCLVFLCDNQSSLFSAVVGVGPLFHEILNQPLINPQVKDVFSVCIARGEDVLIQDPDEGSIAPFIPAWFRGSVSKGPLLLLPVKDSAGTFAVICVVTGRGNRIELTAQRLQQLKRLRSCLAFLREAGAERRDAA